MKKKLKLNKNNLIKFKNQNNAKQINSIKFKNQIKTNKINNKAK